VAETRRALAPGRRVARDTGGSSTARVVAGSGHRLNPFAGACAHAAWSRFVAYDGTERISPLVGRCEPARPAELQFDVRESHVRHAAEAHSQVETGDALPVVEAA